MENMTLSRETVKGFNIKRTTFIILILDNNLKLGIVVHVMPNKMLVMVNYQLLLLIWAVILKT